MRTKAKNILEDEMSDNMLEYIKKFEYLEENIVDAMINFHEIEVKKLKLLDINNRREFLSAFIKDIKDEFKDENCDYLDIILERFLIK